MGIVVSISRRSCKIRRFPIPEDADVKQQIATLLSSAIARLQADGRLPAELQPRIQVENARNKAHGDLASNVALMLAKPAGMNPRELAQLIVDALAPDPAVKSVNIAGPGFINFFIENAALSDVISVIEQAGCSFGHCDAGKKEKVILEYVSANPTGPLHVGHGRGAAYGDALRRLLGAAGYDVHSEYYVNDAGRQMDILAVSVWLRYLDLAGEAGIAFPPNAYQGDYIWDIAATLHREHGDDYRVTALDLDSLPGDDDEAKMDALIARARELLGEEKYAFVHHLAHSTLVDYIRDDLNEFRVEYDAWFSEKSLMDSGAVDAAVEKLRASGHVYEKDGAWWFRSTDFGDEKDRVVVRDNGVKTYFASDIAYHLNKQERGFEHMIDIWGADHHGYVPRVRAAMQALGQNPDSLEVLLVQFAVLYRGGKKIPMSTRSGEFVTLRELRHEVGTDAARFFYVMRKAEQHMDFDLDLAKSQSNENPVYYVQYAHARIASVFRQLGDKGFVYARDEADLARLDNDAEQSLIDQLNRYPELIRSAAAKREPHQIAYFLRETAQAFHSYYNAHQFLVNDAGLRNARLALIKATQQVIANGLDLLGVSAPETM